MGDDVQAIKAGILEIADLFVINKADQRRVLTGWRSRCGLTWGVPIVPHGGDRGRRAWRRVVDAVARMKRQGRSQCGTGRSGCGRCTRSGCSNAWTEALWEAARRVAGRECDPYTIIEGWLRV